MRAETRVAGAGRTLHTFPFSRFLNSSFLIFPFLVLGQPLSTGLICCLFNQSHADHMLGSQDEGSFMKAQVTAALVLLDKTVLYMYENKWVYNEQESTNLLQAYISRHTSVATIEKAKRESSSIVSGSG